MKTKTILIYADPQHAWAKVPKKELVKLGIANEISRFSYERGQFTYLEEDCDLGKYIMALKAKNIIYKFNESWTNKRSKIRSYDSYRKPTVELIHIDRITL